MRTQTGNRNRTHRELTPGTTSAHRTRLAASILLALAVMAGCSANSTEQYLTDTRAGLIVNEGFSLVEVEGIPDEYLLAVGAEICEDLTNGRRPGSYERYVIDNAVKHLC